MGKVETALRDEIARLARKEIRDVVGPLKKEVIRLKKRVAELSSKLTASEKQTGLLVKERRRKKLGADVYGFRTWRYTPQGLEVNEISEPPGVIHSLMPPFVRKIMRGV